jgi:hypothetical protein
MTHPALYNAGLSPLPTPNLSAFVQEHEVSGKKWADDGYHVR